MAGRLAAVVATVALLAGCRADPRTLTIAVALLPSELPVYRAALEPFERTSGWRVLVVPQQYPDIRRALAAEAAGRGTLDLVELDVYSLAPAARDVVALDPAGLGPELAALEPAAVRAGTFEGLRFLPHRVSWQALIYDHVRLGAPPSTWPELLAVARAHPGKIGMKGALYEGLSCDVLPFVWAGGGSGEAFTEPGARVALGFLAALAPYLHPQSATFKEATIAEAMARGELVLHFNWPFVMSLYAEQGLAPGRVRSAPLPRGPAGRATVLGGGYFGIPRGAPHPAGARALLRFLLGRETQARFAASLGWFSARRDLAPGNPVLLAGFTAMRDAVRSRPERVDYPRLSRLWQETFRAVAFEDVAPAVALERAARAWAPRP